jgi:FAD/FMN-containing dehydrogenase
MTKNPAIGTLRSRLRGSLVLPEDVAYDEARAVWNAGDRTARPAAIARCADATDVIRALEVAREAGLPIAVRGGGHSFAGKGTCDGGIVIDCSPMKAVDVDVRRAWRAPAEAARSATSTARPRRTGSPRRSAPRRRRASPG